MPAPSLPCSHPRPGTSAGTKTPVRTPQPAVRPPRPHQRGHHNAVRPHSTGAADGGRLTGSRPSTSSRTRTTYPCGDSCRCEVTGVRWTRQPQGMATRRSRPPTAAQSNGLVELWDVDPFAREARACGLFGPARRNGVRPRHDRSVHDVPTAGRRCRDPRRADGGAAARRGHRRRRDGAPAGVAEDRRRERRQPGLRNPGYDASVDYVAGVLRDAGFDTSTPTYRSLATTARTIGQAPAATSSRRPAREIPAGSS